MEQQLMTGGERQLVCATCGADRVGRGQGPSGPCLEALDAREQAAVAALVRSGLVGLGDALGLRAEVAMP